MRIMKIDKIYDADIETFKGFSLFSFYDGQNWYEFSINVFQNDLYKFVKFIDENKDEVYFAFFNGLKFDCQVIQYVLENYSKWQNLSNLQICERIWEFAQREIDNSNYETFNTFKEEQFSIKCIDLFEIPHFSNKNKRTGLKWLAFMMDMESIEDLPFEHFKVDFTKEEVEKVILYCRKDILDTNKWRKYITGDVEHEVYKGKNKLQDRIDLIEEFGFPEKAINWNDVKIGDELNKKGYLEITGKKPNELYELKKRRGATRKFTYGEAIPEYVKFKTPEFQRFYDSIKDIRVSLLDTDKQEFSFTYNGTTYSVMRGGIHSVEKNRIVIPTSNEILRDADIGSQYPNAIVKRSRYPSHLGEEWLINYKNTIQKRIEYKKKGKDSPKYKGLSEMFKLALNGGGYGKTGEKNSWQYDPRVMYFCTIGNQFEILMLIEMLELEKIHCISANTDGILCLFAKELEPTYYRVCEEWEKIVGNSEMGKLEYTDFKKIWQESVNHYIAIKDDNTIKVKGRFAYEVDLNKNNTDKIGRIERKAICEYVKNGTPVEKTIRDCKNIYDFCIGLKSSRNYYFQTVRDNKFTDYKKIVRFFISNDGSKLIKVKKEDADTNGADLTKISDGYLVTIFNDYYPVESFEDYNINYSYYIDKCKEIIDKVEFSKKKNKSKIPTTGMGSLF